MKIAVISETSAGDRNPDILADLEGRGHDVINAGMAKGGAQPELTYIHTGLLSAILLILGRVDFVVGGCGTGQGYLNAVMQYLGVFCGHILDGLDAWLYTQINGGNCIALALNQGCGWAADVNLQFIFDRLFSVESGCGYPAHRQESQRQSRQTLKGISHLAHKSMAETITSMPEEVLKPVLDYPGALDLIDVETISDTELRAAFSRQI